MEKQLDDEHSSDFPALLLATSSTGKKRPRELETLSTLPNLMSTSKMKNKLQSSHNPVFQSKDLACFRDFIFLFQNCVN